MKSYKPQQADGGGLNVTEHTQLFLLFFTLSFLPRRMQTKVQGTGSEAAKSSVNSALETFSSLLQTEQRPLHARPLKDQPCEMKMPRASTMTHETLF